MHNKKYHPNKEPQVKENTICKYRNGKYASRQSRWRHEQTCPKNISLTENSPNEIKQSQLIQQIQQIQLIQPIIQTQPNPIPDKLFHKYEMPNSNLYVLMRVADCYVNATQICNIGKKIFAHWYYSENAQKLICKITIEQKSSSNIIKHLVDIVSHPNLEQEFWVCPELAYDLTKWISPVLSISLNNWIKSHNSEWFNLKKQKREHYTDKPVIYLITNEELKQKNIFIIGKTNNFANRLSVYNKSCEHEVVYYKECTTDDNMDLAEKIVLNKLDEYREKINRDRFMLPDDKPIDFFIKHISNAVEILEAKN